MVVEPTRDEPEGKLELLLQHVQLEVQVGEGRVSAPQGHLGVLAPYILHVLLHPAQDERSYVGF